MGAPAVRSRSCAALFAAALLLTACGGEPPDASIPELSGPPPLPEGAATPMRGRFRVRMTDVRLDREDVRLSVARASGTLELSPDGATSIAIPALHLDGPRVVLADGGAGGPSDGSAGLLGSITDPRVSIGRITVRDAFIGVSEADGYAWRFGEVGLRVENLRLGGERPDGLRVVSGSAVGRIAGESIRIVQFAAGIERTEDRILFSADADLGPGSVRVEGAAFPTGALRATIRSEGLPLATLQPWLPTLPPAGAVRGAAHIRVSDGRTTIEAEDVSATIGEARLGLDGRIVLAEEPVTDRLVLTIDALDADALERLIGVRLPDGGSLTGRIVTSGTLDRAIAVDGRITRATDAGRSALALDGHILLEPVPALDLQVTGDPLVVAGTPIHLALGVEGPLDSLALDGRVGLPGRPVAGTLDAVLLRTGGGAPVLRGQARLRAGSGASVVHARAEGRVVLSDDGAVDVRIAADSIPLAAFPVPDAVEELRGRLRGTVHVGGTLGQPDLGGRFVLRDAGAFIEPAGLALDSARGTFVLDGRMLRVERFRAEVGGGTLAVGGTVRLLPSPRLALTVRADRVTAVDTEDIRVVASARLDVTGPVTGPTEPLVEGRVRLLDGWIQQDGLGGTGALDLEDPPYRELARDAPWIGESRILGAEPERQPLPVRADVVVAVTPDFRLIDEDSELAGRGTVRVWTHGDAVRAEGTVALETGVYASFGERFEVLGGTLQFDGAGLDPYVILLAQHEEDAPLWHALGAEGHMAERFPPLEYLSRGPLSSRTEQLRRVTPIPETASELGALLLFGAEPALLNRWKNEDFWRPAELDELLGEQAEARGGALIWSYWADQFYDFVPVHRGWLGTDMITAGSRYPGRFVVGSLLEATAIVSPGLRLEAAVPVGADDHVPALRVRYRLTRSGVFEVFAEPRFYTSVVGADDGAYLSRRRYGATVRWRWEIGGE